MHRRQFRNNIIKNSVLINLRFYLQAVCVCVCARARMSASVRALKAG